MSTCDTSGEDFFMSLNGFDEIAIAKSFGVDIDHLRTTPFTFLRALVFVHKRRAEDLPDVKAYAAAQELTIGELQDYFPDPEPEMDPDDPDTEAGKGPSPSD